MQTINHHPTAIYTVQVASPQTSNSACTIQNCAYWGHSQPCNQYLNHILIYTLYFARIFLHGYFESVLLKLNMLVDTIKHMESYVNFRDVIIQNFYFILQLITNAMYRI